MGHHHETSRRSTTLGRAPGLERDRVFTDTLGVTPFCSVMKGGITCIFQTLSRMQEREGWGIFGVCWS